jgi:hypothetical protein
MVNNGLGLHQYGVLSFIAQYQRTAHNATYDGRRNEDHVGTWGIRHNEDGTIHKEKQEAKNRHECM